MKNYLKDLLFDAGQRFLPLKGWIHLLGQRDILRADILAGITVALVLIPQSMAYAQLAGLPPYIGLYASFMVPIVAAIFGSSRQLQNGPVAIISLMTAAALVPLNLEPTEYIAYAAVLALLVGIFQMLMGFLRLGVLVDFLSHPVVIGFTNAAAIVIGSLQLGKLFGIETPRSDHLYETLGNLLSDIPQHAHWPTLLMGIASLVCLLAFKRYLPKWPGTLLTVVIATSVSAAVGYGVIGGAVVGEIPKGLPGFSMPSVNPEHLSGLLMPALIIALLSFVEAFSIAKAIASETRQDLSADQEMVGKGLANITAGVMMGYAVSGSFSRTAVAFDAGAKTGFTAIVSGVLVGITLLFLTPLLFHLPLATLAAVIIVAVIGLIQFQPFKHAWTVNPHDGFVALAVFVVTLITAPHLENGIFVGVALSIAFYLYRTMTPHFAELAFNENGLLADAQLYGLQTSETVALYRYDGDLYFANAGYLERKLLHEVATKPDLHVLVLDLAAVDQIDVTGEEMLVHMSERLDHAGIEFFITRAKPRLLEVLEKSGLMDKIGAHHFFRRREDAIAKVKSRYGARVDVKPLIEHMPEDSSLVELEEGEDA